MFFFFSIMPKTEEIGMVDSCHIYREYSVFYLFFIPVFKWNKRYYAKRFYEDTVYELDSETGEQIENGMSVKIDIPDTAYKNTNICPVCGRELDREYSFCPYCGRKL